MMMKHNKKKTKNPKPKTKFLELGAYSKIKNKFINDFIFLKLIYWNLPRCMCVLI